MILKIEDGREKFYQWDANQKLLLEEAEKCTEIHFANEGARTAYVCPVQLNADGKCVDVPNEVLRVSGKLFVYFCTTTQENGTTWEFSTLEILPRAKPEGYIYTKTEALNYSVLLEQIRQLAEKELATDEVEQLILQYMIDHPVTAESIGALSYDQLESAVDGALLTAQRSGLFKGEKGDTGPQGPQGEKGADGAAGAKGDKGDKGDQGIQGIQGIQGEPGAKGDKGDKGDKGEQGIQGIQGPAGATGSQGPKGDKGDTGATGAKGADGKTPVKGVDYFTQADQEAIVQQVIVALGTPVFGRVDANNNITLTGELADGTYTFKYEDADGNVIEIGTLNHNGEIDYTIPIEFYSGKIDYNNGGAIVQANDYAYSSLIPIESGKKYYLASKDEGVTFGGYRIAYYDAAGNYLSVSDSRTGVGGNNTLATLEPTILPMISNAVGFRLRFALNQYQMDGNASWYTGALTYLNKNAVLTWSEV